MLSEINWINAIQVPKPQIVSKQLQRGEKAEMRGLAERDLINMTDCFVFGATPSDAQQLLMALKSGITTDGAQSGNACDSNWVNFVQGKCPPH